jgi:N-acetylmuramoyl-L-alanine amidase
MAKQKIILILLIIVCLLTGYYVINDYYKHLLKTSTAIDANKVKDDGKIHIVIDAGHGGYDPGASNEHLHIYEKDIDRKVVDAIVAMADTNVYKILQTRLNDSSIHRRFRIERATAFKAKLFLSFHCNYLTGGKMNGFEVNISDSTLNDVDSTSYINPNKSINESIANSLLSNMSLGFPNMANRQIRHRLDRIWVLHAPKFPSLIVEWGYINNKNDIAIMQDPVAHQVLARAVWKSIDQHFGVVKY